MKPLIVKPVSGTQSHELVAAPALSAAGSQTTPDCPVASLGSRGTLVPEPAAPSWCCGAEIKDDDTVPVCSRCGERQ